MKKSILVLAIAAVLFSCKKDETATEFKATDVTGTSVVKGYIDKPIVKQQGPGYVMARAGAQGVPVTVTVNKNSLYPNSTAQGADIYHATTDATGSYAMTVKSNASGVSARLSIDGFFGSIDTVDSRGVRPGVSTTFQGTIVNTTLYMGHNVTINHSL